MAKLLGITPGFQHVDSSGNLLKGGTVTINATGISVYNDGEGLIAMMDPVELDSKGSARIYLKGDADYTYVIKNAAGTTLNTVANVCAVPYPSHLTNDIDVNGNSIISSSAGDITITSDGPGRIILDGQSWPKTDGAASKVLTTDGAGELSLSTGDAEILRDTTPQLGADLDTNSSNIQFKNGTGFEDDSGNEHIYMYKVTDAVNYIDITNAATGGDPTIAAAGDDTNIDLNLNPKNSGAVSVSGLSYPKNDSTADAVFTTDGAGTVSFGSITTSTAAEVLEGTSTSTYVTPSTIGAHKGLAKAWLYYNVETWAILGSLGISSIDDVGTGRIIVNFSTAFASTNYIPLGVWQEDDDASPYNQVRFESPTTTSILSVVFDVQAGGDQEEDLATLVFYGEQ
jgi:hypothetical protein